MIRRFNFDKFNLRVKYELSQRFWFSTKQITEPKQEWINAKSFDSIPGINKLQTLKSFSPNGKYYNLSCIDLYQKMFDEYGMISKMAGLFGRDDIVIIYDPNDFEKVLRSEGQLPYRRGLETFQYYRKNVRPEIYEEAGGLFQAQGEEWQKMRKIMNPVLMQPKIARRYISAIDQITKDFVELSANKRDSENDVPTNYKEYLNRWSIETTTYIALDRRLGVLDENSPNEKATELFQYMRDFFEVSYQFEIMPSIWKFYKTKSFKNLLNIYDGITNINLHYVNEALNDMKNKNSYNETANREPSILEKLLKVNKNVAVVVCADMLLAGTESSSAIVGSILYCLAKNPEKQDILRDEIMKFMPDKNTPLTSEMLNNMPYLKGVFKEGIRLHSPVSGNMRKIASDLVLQGYRVPKGTDVVTVNILLYKNDGQYPESLKFLPERWLKDPIARGQCPSAKDAHPFTYLPFGYGRRMCIGKRFAELQAQILVANMVRRFKLEWHQPEVEIRSVLVNYIRVMNLIVRKTDFLKLKFNSYELDSISNFLLVTS